MLFPNQVHIFCSFNFVLAFINIICLSTYVSFNFFHELQILIQVDQISTSFSGPKNGKEGAMATNEARNGPGTLQHKTL